MVGVKWKLSQPEVELKLHHLSRFAYTEYSGSCLLYTSDAADERSSVDLGGRRIIKKKNRTEHDSYRYVYD